jgi:pyruvate dehydrogenase E1 component alpha subunit
MDKELMRRLYEKMIRMRKFEEGVVQVYEEGLSPGSPHLYIGQEAIGAGVCEALHPDDYILPSHRGHGQIIARGAEMRYAMAELLGRKAGYCKGKGGSMHMAVMDLGILGSIGIVGSNLSIAVGVGHACNYLGKKQVAACFFGDGACNRGTFHESLNLASVLNLPIVYVLENNFFAISGDQRKLTKVKDLAVRAGAYGIPGETADGNDAVKCYAITARAAEHCRSGKGPYLLEFKTWRHLGHWQGDPDMQRWEYRNKAEHEAWLQRDPLKILRQRYENEGYDIKDLDMLDAAAEIDIADAIKFAAESPWPDLSEATNDVYVE